MEHNRVTWKLSSQQFFWLALYAAIFPIGVLVAPTIGNWTFTVSALISLPLLPLGGLAYMGLTSFTDPNFALLFTWLFNLLLAWPMYVQYRAYKARKSSGSKAVVYSVLRIVAIVVTLVLLFRVFLVNAP
jgi:hypothetical protein